MYKRQVEELLDGSGTTLDPVLRVKYAEVLRRLDDAKPAVRLQVGKQLVEKIRSRGEVGVQHQDVGAVRATESEVQVAGLLEPATIETGAITKTEIASHGRQLGIIGVIQNERGAVARIVLRECLYVGPRVAQYLYWLPADR